MAVGGAPESGPTPPPASRRTNETSRVLRGIVRDDPAVRPRLARQLDPERIDPLLMAAERHGVVGWLWYAVRDFAAASDPAVRPVRERHAQLLGAHLRTRAALLRARTVLAAGGIEPVVLKGPVLAEVIYPRPDLRAYGDLDLLVEPDQVGPALELLEADGARLVERNWPLVLDRMLGQLTLVDADGTVVDLHWHLLHERALWSAFTLPPGVAGPTRSVPVGGVEVRALAAEPALVHLALHAAVSGAHRLMWLSDVDQSVRRDQPDWAGVLDLATRWSVGLPVALVLRRVRHVLGTPVPDEVLTGLTRETSRTGGALWAAAGWAVDRAAAVQRWRGQGSPARLFARSTRAGAAASARELTRRAREAALSDLRVRRGIARTDTLFDPAEPTSVAFPAGGAAGRRAYLDAIVDFGAEPGGAVHPCGADRTGRAGPTPPRPAREKAGA